MPSTSSSRQSLNWTGGRSVVRDRGTVLTIGHSNHTAEVFLDLLIRHRVTALADVRSAPYSRFAPHFNRGQLAKTLKASGIRYVYLGRELGGRSNDQSCYDQGHVRYDRLAHMPGFQDGLQRVQRGAEEYRVALMCAEKEPLHCHRTLLVGHELDRRGVDVAHILPDGQLEPHMNAMNRLLAECNLDADGDLFSRRRSRDERIVEAIACQTRRFGHAIRRAVDGPEQKD